MRIAALKVSGATLLCAWFTVALAACPSDIESPAGPGALSDIGVDLVADLIADDLDCLDCADSASDTVTLDVDPGDAPPDDSGSTADDTGTADAADVSSDSSDDDLVDEDTPDAQPDDLTDESVTGSDLVDAGVDVLDEPDEPVEPGPPDLILLPPPENRFNVSEEVFAETDCALADACIRAPGVRRLLRFPSLTANAGPGPLSLGRPLEESPTFVWDDCHEYLIIDGFLNTFRVTDSEGTVVATGQKESFCMADNARFLDDADVRRYRTFHCNSMGISKGWYDYYSSDLPCQWVDITDVLPGDYELTSETNPNHLFGEANYDNNATTVDITIPPLDLAADCRALLLGPERGCGWDAAENGICEPGSTVRVGCGQASSCPVDDDCVGSPLIRVCEGADAHCSHGRALASTGGVCQSACPLAQFTCPPSGVYSVWTGEDDPFESYECALASAESADEPDPLVTCEADPEVGLGRECGWASDIEAVDCAPGFTYYVSCNAVACGVSDVCPDAGASCELGPLSCEGDPMLRVCPGDAPCARVGALADNDDACEGVCPELTFVCPVAGKVTVLTASSEEGGDLSCEFDLVRIVDLGGSF